MDPFNLSPEQWDALTDEQLDEVEAKELDTKTRKGLGTGTFAFPRLRKLPLNDASHVRNAMSRFNQTQGWTSGEKAAAKAKIIRYARKYGIEVGDFGKVSASAGPWTFTVQARGLDLPVVAGHPNRMPFRGILTKVGVPSDKAPNGSDGKRVMLTHEAAMGALDSLLGMGVDLAKDLKGHDVKSKVGLITSAHVEGENLLIEGFIYAADFPQEALRIHMRQAELGFSFEAQNLAVESLDDDPLIVKSCVFTGAAILMKDAAAYQTTSLAAAAGKAKDKDYDMDEIQKAVQEAVAAALAPVAKELADIKAAQGQPMLVAANAAMCARVEPHAKVLEAAADNMEKEGIGLHPHMGHVLHARRMAASMRANAAQGQLPHSYSEAGSYFASAAPQWGQQPTVRDTAEYKALEQLMATQRTEHEASLKKLRDEQADALSSMNTKLADLKAASDLKTDPPARRTTANVLNQFVGKEGIGDPTENQGEQIDLAKLDEVLASRGLSTSERLNKKLELQRQGVKLQSLTVDGAISGLRKQ